MASQKKHAPPQRMLRRRVCGCLDPKEVLLAETEFGNDVAVALNIVTLEIVEQCATLTNEFCQGPFCRIIFTVGLHVLRQMGNTV